MLRYGRHFLFFFFLAHIQSINPSRKQAIGRRQKDRTHIKKITGYSSIEGYANFHITHNSIRNEISTTTIPDLAYDSKNKRGYHHS